MTVSDILRGQLWSQESDLPLVCLIIEHESLDGGVIRVVNNTEAIVSGGEEYVALPFDISMPGSPEDGMPKSKVTIDNVSREIGQAIRQMVSAAHVSIRVVRQDDFDAVEMQFSGLITQGAQFDGATVDFDLAFEDMVREPYPAHSFSPAEYPSLVR